MAANEKEFNDNLNKAISWTNKLSKDFDYENGFYGTVFRQTNPIINGHLLYEMDLDYATWNISPYKFSHYKEALDQVLVLREETQFSYYEDLSKLGRILSFEIGFTTHDGGMIVESQCFFDESDVPPIDTWFYLESKSNKNGIGLLYCWIPKPFEHIVEQTMKFDFFECCRWVK